jgi:hypothetical protein
MIFNMFGPLRRMDLLERRVTLLLSYVANTTDMTMRVAESLIRVLVQDTFELANNQFENAAKHFASSSHSIKILLRGCLMMYVAYYYLYPRFRQGQYRRCMIRNAMDAIQGSTRANFACS